MTDTQRFKIYRGNRINSLIDMVSIAFYGRLNDAEREALNAALELAYSDGLLDGIKLGLNRSPVVEELPPLADMEHAGQSDC